MTGVMIDAGSRRSGLAAAETVRPEWVKVSLIIPPLNEAETLKEMLPTVPTVVHELIIVDGGSTDGTVDCDRMPPSSPIRDVARGSARTGFDAGSGDIVMMMDADGSMDAADIPMFVAAFMAGADVPQGTQRRQVTAWCQVRFCPPSTSTGAYVSPKRSNSWEMSGPTGGKLRRDALRDFYPPAGRGAFSVPSEF